MVRLHGNGCGYGRDASVLNLEAGNNERQFINKKRAFYGACNSSHDCTAAGDRNTVYVRGKNEGAGK